MTAQSAESADVRAHGKGCWYFVAVHACPICGKTEVFRERRWDPRPVDRRDRGEYFETSGCGSHFL